MLTRPEPTTRTAIVTGASQGIGAGLVTRFLEMGYNVAGNSRTISDSTNRCAIAVLARGRGWILVTGSFRIVGEIRSIILELGAQQRPILAQ